METSRLLRHQIIENLILQPTDNVADAAIHRWGLIAAQIISVVGEGGFNALYTRSAFLAHSTFPWIPANPLSTQTDAHFADLKKSMEGQTPAQASAANSLLLITLTDILASLIGEDLTTRILRSAWGDDAANVTGQESKHEQ
jgi:hypothetical protein